MVLDSRCVGRSMVIFVGLGGSGGYGCIFCGPLFASLTNAHSLRSEVFGFGG